MWISAQHIKLFPVYGLNYLRLAVDINKMGHYGRAVSSE